MKTKNRKSIRPSATDVRPSRPTPGAAEGDLETVEADLKMKEWKKVTEGSHEDDAGPLPYGMQKTREVHMSHIPKDDESDTFSPMGTGRPDTDPVADIDNPAGVQGGRGPLNMEGEGDRQNDEAAELENVEPDLEDRIR